MPPRGDGDGRKIVPDRELTGGASFASSATPVPSNLDASLDLVIDSASTTAHTVTLTPRSTGASSTITRQLPAGCSLRIPLEGVAKVALDTTDANVTCQWGPRGSVYPFLSSPGGGLSGLAASVLSEQLAAGNVAPNANATEQMMGFGSSLVITPKKTGKVRVTIWGSVVLTATGDSLTMKMRTGTGSAPALHAAASGTVIGGATQSEAFQSGALAGGTLPSVGFLISGTFQATVGTAQWFDLSVTVTSTVTDALSIVAGQLEELPA